MSAPRRYQVGAIELQPWPKGDIVTRSLAVILASDFDEYRRASDALLRQAREFVEDCASRVAQREDFAKKADKCLVKIDSWLKEE